MSKQSNRDAGRLSNSNCSENYSDCYSIHTSAPPISQHITSNNLTVSTRQQGFNNSIDSPQTPSNMKDNKDVIAEFNEYVNMTASELEKWLKSDDSNSAGWPKDEGDGGESVGHDSGRNIVEILKANPDKDPEKYTDDQIQHMRKVASYCKRHLAQEGASNKDKSPEEVKKTKSYASLKNWGHDFLKAQGKEDSGSKGGSKKQQKNEEEDEDGKEENSEENGSKDEEEDHENKEDEEEDEEDDKEDEDKENGPTTRRKTRQQTAAEKNDNGNKKSNGKSNGKKQKKEEDEMDVDEDEKEKEEDEEQEEDEEDEKENDDDDKKAGDKRKKNGQGQQNGANKKRQTAKGKGSKKEDEEGDDDDSAEEEEEQQEEDDGGNDDDDSKDKSSNGASKKGPKKGETVSWSWGSGNPKGKVLDVKEDK